MGKRSSGKMTVGKCPDTVQSGDPDTMFSALDPRLTVL